jgi:hypothetical protein
MLSDLIKTAYPDVDINDDDVLYKIFGIQRTSTENEIKKVYFKKALKVRNPEGGTGEEMESTISSHSRKSLPL